MYVGLPCTGTLNLALFHLLICLVSIRTLRVEESLFFPTPGPALCGFHLSSIARNGRTERG